MLDKLTTVCYNKENKTREVIKMFKKVEKKTPKYLVHIVGTSDVNFVYEDKVLENIINIYGKDRVDITNLPLKF